jgi:type II secretory pathway pseudopilin PulG
MKQKQDGFSAVEVVIIIVVVGLLGFGGWYMWQSKNKENKTDNTTSQQQNTNSSNAQSETDTPVDTNAYADWQSYAKDDLSFKYPADWTLAEIGPGPQLKSSDYASTGLQMNTVTKGASIAISTPGAAQTAVTAENYNTSSLWSPAYSDFKVVTINGKKAAQYKIGEEIVNTVLFNTDGKMTSLQFRFAAADNAATVDVYNYLLQTVEAK